MQQLPPNVANPDNRLKVTTEDPEQADRFDATLSDVVEALSQTQLRYAFIGGIASSGLGRPRSTHDIDLFVPPEEAELTLRALAKAGFRTERTDPSWLYKAFKNDILVDVIFKSKGEIYLDQEMYTRTITASFHGQQLRLVAPEDLLIIKAAAHSELCPNHWHDATALLSHASLDWPYLLKRARRAPRRILSLLLYAQSNDIWVPNHVVLELFNGVFGNVDRGSGEAGRDVLRNEGIAPGKIEGQSRQRATVHALSPASRPAASTGGLPPGVEPLAIRHIHEAAMHQEYAVSHLRECLAEDERTNELDIQIDQSPGRLLLRGEVTAPHRREAVAQIARECFPTAQIENQIRVLDLPEPYEAETMP
jgi:predicted nucleotidyltransferase